MCKVLVCWTVAFNICLCVGAWYVCGVVSAYFARAGKLNSFHVALATHHETDERCRTTLVLLGCHMAVSANQHIATQVPQSTKARRTEQKRRANRRYSYSVLVSSRSVDGWASCRLDISENYTESRRFSSRDPKFVFCEIYSRNNCGLTVIVFF